MIFFRKRPDYDPDKEMTLQLRFRIWTSGLRGGFVLMAFLLTGLACWKGRETYGRVKVWRAEALVAESEAARARGDFTEASNKLGQATALLLRHPVTLRAVARYQVAMHDLSALNTYVELLKTGQATLDDKIAFVREAFRLGRPTIAVPTLEQLAAANPTGSTVLSLLAEQSAWKGNWQEAVKQAREASRNSRNEEEKSFAQLVLAKLLLQPPTLNNLNACYSEGFSLLSSLGLRKDDCGLEALHLLVGLSQNLSMSEFFRECDVQPLLDSAESHPQADAELKVGCWSLRLAAGPSQRVQITRAFFDHFKSISSPALQLEAARWLNKRGMHRLALDLAEPVKFASQDWFVLYLDIVAALGRWEDIHTLLTAKDQKPPLSPTLRKLFELRSAMETDRHPDTERMWREIQAANRSEDPATQLYVAGYAEQTGFPSEAAVIYRRLLNFDSGKILPATLKLSHLRRLACFMGLLRTGAGALPLDQLEDLVAAFAAEFPEMDEVQNDHAYLQLLLGQDLEDATATAQRLLKKKPELLAYRTTAALAALRREKTTEAAAIYEGWTVDWTTAQDRYKAVYIAVMRAAGKTTEAEKVVATAQSSKLRPEERVLAGLP